MNSHAEKTPTNWLGKCKTLKLAKSWLFRAYTLKEFRFSLDVMDPGQESGMVCFPLLWWMEDRQWGRWAWEAWWLWLEVKVYFGDKTIWCCVGEKGGDDMASHSYHSSTGEVEAGEFWWVQGWLVLHSKSADNLSGRGNDSGFDRNEDPDAVGRDFRKTGTSWTVDQVLPWMCTILRFLWPQWILEYSLGNKVSPWMKYFSEGSNYRNILVSWSTVSV